MWLQSLTSSLNPQQAFLLGCALTFIGLIAITIFNVSKYKELARRYAHTTNENDFLHAELMLTISKSDPEIIREIKSSDDYGRIFANYYINKQFIDKNGRRP